MAEPGKGRGKSGGRARRQPAKSRSSSARGGASARRSTSPGGRGPKARAGAGTRTNGGGASSGRAPQHAGGAGDFSGKNAADLRDALARSINAPLNLLMLTRDRIEEVVSDAVSRGRMTADDAQELIQGLVARGRDQTGDVLADLEQLLGLSGGEEDDSSKAAPREPERTRRGSAFPIADYEDLNAAQVLSRLGDLSAPDLRKVRSYEAQHANRKTVLNAVDSKLR